MPNQLQTKGNHNNQTKLIQQQKELLFILLTILRILLDSSTSRVKLNIMTSQVFGVLQFDKQSSFESKPDLADWSRVKYIQGEGFSI
jgi:hypothetical protein